MSNMKDLLGDIDFEEFEEVLNDLSEYYREKAINLLYTGTSYQKKCIRHYMLNMTGRQRTDEIRRFIAIGISIGKVEA